MSRVWALAGGRLWATIHWRSIGGSPSEAPAEIRSRSGAHGSELDANLCNMRNWLQGNRCRDSRRARWDSGPQTRLPRNVAPVALVQLQSVEFGAGIRTRLACGVRAAPWRLLDRPRESVLSSCPPRFVSNIVHTVPRHCRARWSQPARARLRDAARTPAGRGTGGIVRWSTSEDVAIWDRGCGLDGGSLA